MRKSYQSGCYNLLRCEPSPVAVPLAVTAGISCGQPAKLPPDVDPKSYSRLPLSPVISLTARLGACSSTSTERIAPSLA